jgi:hypothetical protein
MNNFEHSAANSKWKAKVSPPFFKEGWLRPQFCQMALYLPGDGVVESESVGLFSTTSPKSMILRRFNTIRMVHMDLGTPPVQEEYFSVHQNK